MTWFVRSLKAGDTHRGTLSRGRVHAACGIQFAPLPAFGGSALPGAPPGPDQACPECREALADGRVQRPAAVTGPATQPASPPGMPGGGDMVWALSAPDWRWHAVGGPAGDPSGVQAECGDLLTRVAILRKGPAGTPCEKCAEIQFDRAQTQAASDHHVSKE